MSGDYLLQDDEYHGRHLDLRLWRRILAHALPYRRQLISMSVAGMVLAGIDVLFPLVTAWLIDEATAAGRGARLIALIGAYVVLMIGFAACVWCFIRLAGRIASSVAHDLRRDAFARLQELSFSYYDVRPVGWLMTRMTSDCSKLSSLIPWFVLDLVWGSCTIVGIVVAMLLLHWPLALTVMLIVPPLVVVSFYFQRKLLQSSRLMRKTNSQITANFNESLMGVRTTKTLVREAANLREFQVLSSDMYRYCMQNVLQSAAYLPLVIILGSLGVGLALWRGGVSLESDLGLGAGLSLGTLVAFMQYAALFSMPIQDLARRFTDLQSAQAAAERVQSLLDTEPEIKDSPEVVQAIAAQAARPARRDVALDGGERRIETIEFRKVGFWYKPGEPILQDFTLTISTGQTVALVGPTGGGKSTIVSLISRFYEPTQGEILINGVDYRDRSLHWLQSNLGVVLQSPHLFSGTIAENIRYGRLEASDEEVRAAAKLVNADEFILDLEDGYQSEVGEGGGRLSTGQRQLISLARAVLADPQIFIMDEATSSVDTESERLIQQAIEVVLQGRIALVIAHRLSTIRSADVILVIDGGRIIEQGQHEQLLQRRGRYHTLYTRQFALQPIT